MAEQGVFEPKSLGSWEIFPSAEATTTLCSSDSREILIIRGDGRLERGSGFRTDDEASVALFDCMSKCIPCAWNALRARAEAAESELAALKAKAREVN